MTQCPKYDFHIHTKYSGCGKDSMTIPAIIAECERLGLEAIGISDHIDTKNPIELHKNILADLRKIDTKLDVYFGAELDFVECDGGFLLDEEQAVEYGFQYVVAGVHSTYVDEYDLRKIVDIQHRHHIKICENPLVNVVAHPYHLSNWRFSQMGWPKVESMKMIPESYARQLGQIAAETNTAIEINAYSVLVDMGGPEFAKRYVNYLAIVAEEGPMFSVGSDAHSPDQLNSIEKSWNAAETLGLSANRIYRPLQKKFNAT